MKIKASILALAVPVALLVGCNRAESPSAENANNESSTLSPAAATGATGLDTNAAGETGVNVNSPGVITDPGVVSEGGAGATSPMTNPGNATGMGTGATGNGTMGTGAGTNSMPNNTPSGTPTPATKGNMQNAPADELGHPKRPAG